MNDLIYNQKRIPNDKWRYGFRSSAKTGCGWIAVYNALHIMGYRAEPQALIRYFERSLPVINGNFGTFILTPAAFFRKKGFPVTVTARKEKLDETAKSSDVCILFYYWRRKYKLGAHFVTVYFSDGRFYGCNTFGNSSIKRR